MGELGPELGSQQKQYPFLTPELCVLLRPPLLILDSNVRLPQFIASGVFMDNLDSTCLCFVSCSISCSFQCVVLFYSCVTLFFYFEMRFHICLPRPPELI